MTLVEAQKVAHAVGTRMDGVEIGDIVENLQGQFPQFVWEYDPNYYEHYPDADHGIYVRMRELKEWK